MKSRPDYRGPARVERPLSRRSAPAQRPLLADPAPPPADRNRSRHEHGNTPSASPDADDLEDALQVFSSIRGARAARPISRPGARSDASKSAAAHRLACRCASRRPFVRPRPPEVRRRSTWLDQLRTAAPALNARSIYSGFSSLSSNSLSTFSAASMRSSGTSN